MTIRMLRGLSELASFRRLHTSQLEDFMFAGSTVTPRSRRVLTSRILRKLRARGYVEVLRRPAPGPRGGSGEFIYGLAEDGARYVAAADPAFRGVRRPPADAASIEHALMAADVYLAFLRSARARLRHHLSAWDPDWCAAQLLGPSRVIPDGHLVYQTEEWEVDAFVEVDLGTESPARFERKVAEYVAALREGSWQERLPTWPLVLTVTPSLARATLLRAATEKVLRRERVATRLMEVALFYFVALGDLRAAADPLGCIWHVAGQRDRHALIPAGALAGPDDAVSVDAAAGE